MRGVGPIFQIWLKGTCWSSEKLFGQTMHVKKKPTLIFSLFTQMPKYGNSAPNQQIFTKNRNYSKGSKMSYYMLPTSPQLLPNLVLSPFISIFHYLPKMPKYRSPATYPNILQKMKLSHLFWIVLSRRFQQILDGFLILSKPFYAKFSVSRKNEK